MLYELGELSEFQVIGRDGRIGSMYLQGVHDYLDENWGQGQSE